MKRRLLAALALSVLALTLVAPPAAVADTSPPAGTPATLSADPLPTWQINGVVWAQVVVNNIVYVTGSFDKARPPGVKAGGVGEVDAKNIFAYDIRTGTRVAGFNHSLNAQGRAITATPDGKKVFVGGDFTAVDGVARGHVAAFVTATNALDPVIQPNVNNMVRALAATDTTLYIGGQYWQVNGLSRNSLSAVNVSSGGLYGWRPKVDDYAVWSMVLAPGGTRLIVGGSFTKLNGVDAYGMGALDLGTGATLPWAANQRIRTATSAGAITSLRTDGQQVYGSGYAYGGGKFEGTFAAEPSTGNITVVNDCHGDTYDVLPLGPVLYSVSHAHDCTWIRSFPDTSPRVRWEHALAQTIAPTTTNIGPDNYGWNFGGLPASANLHWYPQFSRGKYTGQTQATWSLAGNSQYVSFGGEFPTINGRNQQGLTRMAIPTVAPNTTGSTYTNVPARPAPVTTATKTGSGSASVSFDSAWDYDNNTLSYELLRDGGTTAVKVTTASTNFWTLPRLTLVDTGLRPGTSHTYRIRVKDPFGNTVTSPVSNAVTV